MAQFNITDPKKLSQFFDEWKKKPNVRPIRIQIIPWGGSDWKITFDYVTEDFEEKYDPISNKGRAFECSLDIKEVI